MKKRILCISDAINVFTGFANVARHVSTHLHNTGNFEVGYLSWFHAPINPHIKIPFPFYTTLKDHTQCCGRGQCVMRVNPDGNINYFRIDQKTGVLVPMGPGPNCLGGRILEHDKYAFQSLQGIVLDWKPDIVWSVSDCWMQYHCNLISLRPSYRYISYFPIDGSPMPYQTEMGGQKINWVDAIDKSDIGVAYCDFGRDSMMKTAKLYNRDLSKVKVIYHGNDNTNYHPEPEKKLEYRKKWYNFGPEVFVMGMVSRNQPRKALHKMAEALALGKKKGYWSGKNFKCVIHAPVVDVGWNLPWLAKWYDIEDIWTLNPKLQVGQGPTDAEMNEIYNSFDLHTIPSRGEGWGMGYSESMAAGIPTLISSYSAHDDWAKGGAARIAIKTLDAEPITNIDRAIVDVEDYCEKIKAFVDNITIGEYIKKFGVLKDWSGKSYPPVRGAETPIREYFSKEGREVCEKYLSWDKICKQWEDTINSVDIRLNKPYPQVNIPKPVNLNELLEKDKKDRILFAMPGTFGDVFLSTAVVNSIKKKWPEKDIYFTTAPQFKEILQGNKDIFKVLDFDQIFTNTNVTNQMFEMTFTPFVSTQMANNWTRNGYGKHLVETYANECGVELGKPYIQILDYQDAPKEYVVIHAKTGQEPKDWKGYEKIANSIDISVVQIGGKNDPILKGTIDCRGKTIQETAGIIKKAKLFIGGDSICAHLAGYCKTPSILLYSSTFPQLTNYPFEDYSRYIIEPKDRYGCDRPCHLAKCMRGKRSCIDNISYEVVLKQIKDLNIPTKELPQPTLSGYTTTYNPNKYYPWRQSIKSMLGFCDEVVVIDGGSIDGTYEELQEWKKTEPKLKVFKRKWSDDEPSMDGRQKAFSRNLTTKDFCWQMDCDEIVHEKDYDKIKKLIRDWPFEGKMLSLPVLDLYGTDKNVRLDKNLPFKGLYKWRLSINNPDITHGITKRNRKTNDKGKLFCNKDLEDSCFPISAKTGELISDLSFITPEIMFQGEMKETDVAKMKKVFQELPSVWHYSWADLDRRIRLDMDFWDKQWALLGQQEEKPNRFLGITSTQFKALSPEEQDKLIKEKVDYFKAKTFDGKDIPLLTIDWTEGPEVMKGYKK